jgi:uncharacterized protein (DUF1778 family)
MAKTVPINMRAEPEQQAILSKAASLLNMDRSSFVLDAACREAENVLLNQRLFQLDENKFNAFADALIKPLPSGAKLESLLTARSPWE